MHYILLETLYVETLVKLRSISIMNFEMSPTVLSEIVISGLFVKWTGNVEKLQK